MAQHLTLTEIRNYPLSNGTTVDLVNLISTNRPSSWVRTETVADSPVGTIVYASAMGSMRRGVVVKVTRTKVHVALTTQGAMDWAAKFGHAEKAVRVQIVVAEPGTIFTAPKPLPAPVDVAAKYATEELFPLTVDVEGLTAQLQEDEANAIADAQIAQVENWLARHREMGTPRTQWSPVEDARQADHAEALDIERETVTGTEAEALTHRVEIDEAHRLPRETTGSAVVQLLEKVWARIRQNHPQLPAVVIITGAGLGFGGGKWGHFRANGWTAKAAEEGVATSTRLDEMFMAGETLAKGARQVLQTMLHEGAHTLAKVREIQETSRQGRWHNGRFLELAVEMGLTYKNTTADKAIGFSQVTLTEATIEEYADLLTELDRKIHLMVSLPGWLGGDAGQDGGESMGKAPKPPAQPNTNNVKATCLCEEPNIVRMSRKVLDKRIVVCDTCQSHFLDRS